MQVRDKLRSGLVIPAHPLALNSQRRLDERRQRALTRYYLAAGAGGVAVAVHTTQFAIREHGLLEPVLQLAQEECRARDAVKIAGVCGKRPQAIGESQLAARLGYDAVTPQPGRPERRIHRRTRGARESHCLDHPGHGLLPATLGRRALSPV